MDEYIDLTEESVAEAPLACIIRRKTDHPGIEAKRAWLSDQAFAAKYGFRPVDTAPGGYTLLALSPDGTTPHFAAGAKRGTLDESGLVVYYDDQCPFLPARVETLRVYCEEKGIQADFRHVGSLAEAKALPSVFNNFAVFWNGQLITVNQIDPRALEKSSGVRGHNLRRTRCAGMFRHARQNRKRKYDNSGEVPGKPGGTLL